MWCIEPRLMCLELAACASGIGRCILVSKSATGCALYNAPSLFPLIQTLLPLCKLTARTLWRAGWKLDKGPAPSML